MILCLDVGNSQIYGGIFDQDELQMQFRKSSKTGITSDEMGLFLRSVLRENGYDPDEITNISVCTVVPDLLHSIKNCCLKYFSKNPFVLQAGAKTGLKLKYRNPVEVGTDRVANAIAASYLYPDENVVIVDFGTATTFCAVSANKEYLGGVILPGLRISMQTLESNTSKLPTVEIVVPETCVGRSTVESIQSGLYYGTKGAVREITDQITQEAFAGKKPKLIGTGGFASLYRDSQIFDNEVPDLVLKGLYLALKMNA